jgi:hypothetical protein
MPEELGKIHRPSTEHFQGTRKLFFVPMVFTPFHSAEEFKETVDSYWKQVQDHVSGLETKLGNVRKVFHELVSEEGDAALKTIEGLGMGSYKLTNDVIANGAILVPIEDADLLAEFMDWNNCLALGLQSQNALTKIYDSFTNVDKKRNEHIASRLEESLDKDEIGLLFMREGHKIQFPLGIQVFYVSPPGLNDINRWLRDQEIHNDAP